MTIYRKNWSSGESSVALWLGSQSSLQSESLPGCLSGLRSEVQLFSGKSKTRLRRFLQNTPHQYRVMITLTYGMEYPASGCVAKSHLKRFRQLLLNHKLVPESVCWFLEFQNRGAPHFHLLSTDFIPFMAVAWLWHWSSGAPLDTATNVKRMTRPVRYAVKYAKKATQKDVPEQFQDVGRFWGIWFGHRVYAVEASKLNGACLADEKRALKGIENAEQAAGKIVLPHNSGFLAFPRA